MFDSWLGDRAVTYRRINHIPDDWGTAVNVQQMVFGNKGERSCSGVAFSRDEVTGAPEPSGDFLVNAQGEDVGLGRAHPARHPRDARLDAGGPRRADGDPAHARGALQGHAGHGVHRRGGQLFMLQTRNAKRPAQAAVRFAVDAVEEGLLDRAEAIATIDADSSTRCCTRPSPRTRSSTCSPRASPASPGAAKGAIVFTAQDAVAAGEEGRDVILVRPFTEADDVAGFYAAKGILTAEGGKASHAALVARGMGKPCVAGAARAARSTSRRRPSRSAGDRAERGRPDRDRRLDRLVTADDVPLDEPEVSTRPLRDRARAGPTSSAGSACAPTPTRPRTPPRRASSAPRGSGCAAPSTCSWPPTASPRCAR